MSESKIAIVMSTFNEERYIDRCLEAIAAQTIPCDVVVVDGGSRDRTTARLKSWAASLPSLQVVIDEKRRSLPAALNVAVALTDKPFVAKVDARTFIAPDFLERAMEVFEQEGDRVACVGGRPEQHGETPFGEGVARARMSPFGVGASGYADNRRHSDVDSVQCGIYRRDAVLAVGGFDPALQFGEDEELNWRLRRAGYRIVRDTTIRFEYITRPTWRSAFRQYRNYGRARVNVWRKHRDFLRPHHLAPSVAIVGAVGLLLGAVLLHPLRVAAVAAFGAYALAAVMAATVSSRERPSVIPFAAAAFPALHLGYGIGLLEGLLKRRR